MVFHMAKTTLEINDDLMARLKAEAARRRKTMSEMVESALRRMLDERKPRRRLPPLPHFDGGEFLVDITNREKLYDAMDGL